MASCHDTIVILDFGSQYTQLIARRIRETRVHSVILPASASLHMIREHGFREYGAQLIGCTETQNQE